MAYLREVRIFCWAVVNNWAGYATGGLIVASYWLWQIGHRQELPWEISRRAAISLAVLFLFLAFFKAWQSQYLENEAGRAAGSLALNQLGAICFKQGVLKEGAIQISLTLTNLQQRLIEYSVERFDLTVGSNKAGTNYSNRGGYIYSSQPTQFRAPQVQVSDISKSPITGTLSYEIAYHVNGSEFIHHSAKELQFDFFPEPGYVQYLITSEHED